LLIQQKPGVGNKELINLTKLNRKNLSYNLKRLREQKLIWAVKNNGVLGYEFITKEKLHHEMATRLISKLLSDEIDEETYHKIKHKLDTVDINELMS
jgi:predicted transcriptional regulator